MYGLCLVLIALSMWLLVHLVEQSILTNVSLKPAWSFIQVGYWNGRFSSKF